ncbi:unnamed protein product [Prorocentrum cordatum]|uniref:Uncharacterized protein n=1 Tax=Prorocentrum cordatum TaxID=2364126 RepID=A0ABN9XJA9_9DINO|nr:unnamed protein product [Polarella glacialis]
MAASMSPLLLMAVACASVAPGVSASRLNLTIPSNQKVTIDGVEVYSQSAGFGILNSCQQFASEAVSDESKPSITVCGTGTKVHRVLEEPLRGVPRVQSLDRRVRLERREHHVCHRQPRHGSVDVHRAELHGGAVLSPEEEEGEEEETKWRWRRRRPWRLLACLETPVLFLWLGGCLQCCAACHWR